MNQVKTLCLAIVRTIILERRSVPTIAKAMDVVLDSYTRLMKMGGAFPGVRRTHEQNQQSDSQPGSHVVSQEPSPVVNPDQASGAVNMSVQSNSGVEHAMDRGLLNMNISSDSVEITSDAVDKKQQALGEASRPLSTGTLAQHGQHVETMAISPIEMFQSVFTLVEDEMMGDPAYLIAVIMEFLRR